MRKTLSTLLVILAFVPRLFADPPTGSETVLDLYAPVLAGGSGFVTSQGGAPASALNPAQGGDAQRIVFDAGYMGLTTTTVGGGWGNIIDLAALLPTKYVVLGSALHFVQSPGFDGAYPIGLNFGGNLSAAKELYPGLSLGVGLNLGIGTDDNEDQVWTAAGDLGMRHNLGNLGPLMDFTYAFAMRGLGHSYTPDAFTPALGASFDFIHLEGRDDNPDPLKAGMALDFTVPGFQNVTGKIGAYATLAELVTVSLATGFNANDIKDDRRPSWFPSIGLTVHFMLLSSGGKLAGGRLPSDGDLSVTMAYKPLYQDVFGLGIGASWAVGVLDKKPPVITLEYPEPIWISPNNDGNADVLEFPISIDDQRYVAEWAFEIMNDSGALVRTYRNKELRVETQGVKNIMSRLIAGKGGVEVPPSLRWDGILDSGDIAGDGVYTFVVRASDDNGNEAVTQTYTVTVDNTPPEITVEEIAESDKIFSPDGDGNKDTLTITQSGSQEELWEAGFYNTAGVKVKTLNQNNAAPGAFTWDGTDDAGRIVPDGVYSYRIGSTDRAKNSESTALENIVINTIQPTVGLSLGDAYFSPNNDGIKDTIALNASVPVKEGITTWSLEIKDSGEKVYKTFSGTTTAPAARINFDGKDDGGSVLNEGSYYASLKLNYRNGYVSSAISPFFTLDVSAPRASARTEFSAFSPNNDGNQDALALLQEGSEELAWVGEIRRVGAAANERPARTIRFSGAPAARIYWDGFTDAGALARDGEYTYQLSATDLAGNSGKSNTVTFTLSTADTPVLLTTDYRAFSPNNDRVKDTISIIPQLQVTQGVSGWKLDVLNSSGIVVQSFNGSNGAPAPITWNGRDSLNNIVPDDDYTARIEVYYAMGNQPTAVSRPFTVDTAAPKATVNSPYTLFSPNADNRRDTLPLNVVTEGDDVWEAAITDSRGNTVQSWTWTGPAPSSFTWDGKDQAGNSAADGTYNFTLSSTDEGGNSTRVPLNNITVDARVPRAILTSSSNAVAPKGGLSGEALRFSVMLTPRDGIESWRLELLDESGAARKRFPAAGDTTQAPPEVIRWNGYDDGDILREGKFTPRLTVNYTKGDVVNISAPAITVDVSGPTLSFKSSPEYFSPDNDGVDDELFINLGAQDVSSIANWSLEIREPEPPNLLFYRIEGRGSPAERTIWDGRSSKGELVQSATDYPYLFRAADSLGNSSILEGNIGIDVLVIRDGDRLKIQVPSIVFRANEADFVDLPQNVVENNYRVLRRIAEILNKFKDYKVQVEGHANPTSRVPPPAEAQFDLNLSERRARTTTDFLNQFGVSRGRLSATGVGSTRPIIAFEDHDNWWKNRRVEFILIK
jgi:flagellar hook assembly protein FlgD/flagellar motor protein MotB